MIASGEITALHVCTRYQHGGSERRVQDSIRALPHLRHHLVVGAESDPDLARRETAAQRVWVLPSLVRPVSPSRDVLALLALRKLVRSGGYSLVVSHQSKAGVLARSVAAAAGLPAVHSLSMASFGPGYGRMENLLFPWLERTLGTRTAAFCVVGDDLAGRFARLGIPPDRLHVVRSAVPLPASLTDRATARRRVDARHGTTPGRRLVCYVGSLEPRKNPLLLVELLKGLRLRLADPPDLLVVGDGPEHARLLGALRAAGLAQHATLTGHLSDRADVADALRASDVTVLLSRAEGLPQVLVQSAAAGTPFVAFDVEGVRELLDLGAHGSAVPLGRLDRVVDAVSTWIAAGPETREPVLDLSSWSAPAIAAGYRAVVGRVLGPTVAQPSLVSA